MNDGNSVNEKNAKEFEELMKDSSTDVDKYYYDSKNPFVKLLLIVLACIIIVGCLLMFVFK